MPKRIDPARDRRIYNRLAELTRHMRSCGPCGLARKSSDPSFICLQGQMMTLKAAWDFQDVIKLRIAAHTKHPDAIFACPDLALHGAAYAATAEPCMVIAVQESLF